MWYVIGLGNPGDAYENTRHNVGRDMVTLLAEDVTFSVDKFAQAQVGTGVVSAQEVTWMLPETYMNKSGVSVGYVVQKQGAAPQTCIVLYDDVDLPIGEFKISTSRGAGGHNGIKSIIDAIGKDFVRVRVGVARKSFWTGKARRPEGAALSEHVLGRFSSSEARKIHGLAPEIKTALTLIMTEGVGAAMNRFN